MKFASDKTESIRRALLGDLRRIFLWRYGPEFPDDDAGRDDLQLLLSIHALHPTRGPEHMRHAVEVMAPWMKEEEKDMLLSELACLDRRYLWPSREELRDKIRLSTAERELRQAWRVRPFDKTDEEFAEYTRTKRNERRKLRRRRAGVKPRALVQAKSIESRKPWKQAGCSRATWYRRQVAIRETGVAPVLDSLKPIPRPVLVSARETGAAPGNQTLQGPDQSHAEIETGKNQRRGLKHG